MIVLANQGEGAIRVRAIEVLHVPYLAIALVLLKILQGHSQNA